MGCGVSSAAELIRRGLANGLFLFGVLRGDEPIHEPGCVHGVRAAVTGEMIDTIARYVAAVPGTEHQADTLSFLLPNAAIEAVIKAATKEGRKLTGLNLVRVTNALAARQLYMFEFNEVVEISPFIHPGIDHLLLECVHRGTPVTDAERARFPEPEPGLIF